MPVARGFLFAGLHAGIKPFKKDLALVVSESPCSAAGALTINKAKAAPVEDCVRRLPMSGVRAVLINSGNANALTGAEGLQDVVELCAATGKVLEVGAETVLMASTGVIGQRLPKAKMVEALPRLKAQLKAAPESAAEAICTTDTIIKIASRAVRIGRKEGRITAICKGSGMIAPQLASTIAIICTDVAITPALLHQALIGSMEGSFNNLTVDNDMSTNDAVIALANGQLGNPEITEANAEYELFATQLQSLCVELAREVAKDGEGATKLLEVRVLNAPTLPIATDLARSVAGSTLVKAAVFGADPNWGRVLATVGARCGSQKYDVNPGDAKVTVQGIVVYDRKPTLDLTTLTPTAGDGPSGHPNLRARMRSPEVLVEIDLRCGEAASVGWGCDLSYDYVKINADYTSLLVPTADGSVAKDDRLTNYSPKFKVNLVKEALTYISRFADKRVVIKLGRQAMGKDSLRASIVEDVQLLRAVGLVPILVHGESPEGTSKGDTHSKEMMVSGQTNTELVTLLNRTGVQAIGLSGMDASFMKGRRMGEGLPGEVVSINSDLLEMFLQRNYVPVVSPVGFLDDGSTLPLEPDQVASEIARTAKASKLVFLVGGPGFVENDELLGQINTTTLRQKVEKGIFNKNLARKAKWAIAALEGGVERVHVIDARTPHSIIAEFFTDQGIGSLVTHG
ncbi:MAG: bifunctional glutamate N-acetyltransferase/amino-acid acetyltransferase ArgJ [Archangium sp.]|nr:bifunctional glutamate N-acetyltransferase/amino-acid acetyltransferase ArgJ [Archangium sp.]MDP3155955.1 bifunctional glutamate N-acetyltransferase/amino-acid acetyltransferase ArgJ [Archangium sp.]MDP3576149.1 bifunctional glutamate N-acetyltransferase/amino-acid acetyltransferase ArgJ [Archangium sp.]